MAIPYQLVRSSRKTIGIQVRQERVVVHAPLHTSEGTIKRFVYENENWIRKQLAKNAALQNRAEAQGLLSEEDINALTEKAKQILPERIAYYAKRSALPTDALQSEGSRQSGEAVQAKAI